MVSPPIAVTIRPAAAADLPQLTEIYNHYIVNTPTTFDMEPFSIDQRRGWFSRYRTAGRYRLLVARHEGEVLGYTSSSPFHARAAYDTTVETTILCAPERTGMGIGSLLYGALFEALAGEDVHLAIAAVTMPNDASAAIHEKFGFARAALLPEVGRKFDRYWDVAWYVKRL
jgi:phosphinothricin acetyltransferase